MLSVIRSGPVRPRSIRELMLRFIFLGWLCTYEAERTCIDVTHHWFGWLSLNAFLAVVSGVAGGEVAIALWQRRMRGPNGR